MKNLARIFNTGGCAVKVNSIVTYYLVNYKCVKHRIQVYKLYSLGFFSCAIAPEFYNSNPPLSMSFAKHGSDQEQLHV